MRYLSCTRMIKVASSVSATFLKKLSHSLRIFGMFNILELIFTLKRPLKPHLDFLTHHHFYLEASEVTALATSTKICTEMDSKLLILVALCLLPSAISEEEIWEKEMGKEVYIEASVDGLKAVHLKCFDDKMRVNVELEESGFDGVIYTRGSFKAGKKPCFYDAKGVENEKFTLEWTFEQCKTETRGDKKTNEIIVQQDDMLIFPGDMAFELICKGQEATIGLADPDPGAKPLPRKRRKPVTGSNGEVTFTPEHVLKQKSEL